MPQPDDGPPEAGPPSAPPVRLATVAREWGRIGVTGFGGPPAHIALLRQLCVQRREWIGAAEFDDAIAAANMLPGPASTQLAIWCGWRVRGRLGALLAGCCFIAPGLLIILALSAVFLAHHPPTWILGAAAGTGSAVPAVAVQAAWSIAPGSWNRIRNGAAASAAGPARSRRLASGRWIGYAAAGGLAAALAGPFLVLFVLGCGLTEILWRLPALRRSAVETAATVPGTVARTDARAGSLREPSVEPALEPDVEPDVEPDLQAPAEPAPGPSTGRGAASGPDPGVGPQIRRRPGGAAGALVPALPALLLLRLVQPDALRRINPSGRLDRLMRRIGPLHQLPAPARAAGALSGPRRLSTGLLHTVNSLGAAHSFGRFGLGSAAAARPARPLAAASGRLLVVVQAAAAAAAAGGVLLSIFWVAFKVGALSYGGGFVIIPLMQHDVVHVYHWMSNAQFLDAVALGQVTPGPVVLTVGVVGYAAAGLGGALLAVLVAFTPSFLFVLFGARHLDRIRGSRPVQAFLTGAGPASIGAIAGSAVPLALAMGHAWQYPLTAAAALWLLAARRGVVTALLLAAACGVLAALAGLPVG